MLRHFNFIPTEERLGTPPPSPHLRQVKEAPRAHSQRLQMPARRETSILLPERILVRLLLQLFSVSTETARTQVKSTAGRALHI